MACSVSHLTRMLLNSMAWVIAQISVSLMEFDLRSALIVPPIIFQVLDLLSREHN